MFDVITIGETMVMVTPTSPEPLESSSAFSLEVGGSESNVALYLRELGHSTTWVSRLGADPLGRRITGTLGSHGVDLSFVSLDDMAPTGLYVKDPGRGETRVHYYRANSAASRMTPDLLRDLPLTSARLVHLTGITPGLSDTCRDLVRSAFEMIAPIGALLSFDVNFRAGIWSVVDAAPVLLEFANRADVTLVGLDEAATLWNTITAADVRALLPAPTRLVVKDGAVGATEFRRENGIDVVTFLATPPVTVVEVVGAGDAFAAGYLSGILNGLEPLESLRLGHRLAARALTTTGDYHQEDRNDE